MGPAPAPPLPTGPHLSRHLVRLPVPTQSCPFQWLPGPGSPGRGSGKAPGHRAQAGQVPNKQHPPQCPNGEKMERGSKGSQPSPRLGLDSFERDRESTAFSFLTQARSPPIELTSEWRKTEEVCGGRAGAEVGIFSVATSLVCKGLLLKGCKGTPARPVSVRWPWWSLQIRPAEARPAALAPVNGCEPLSPVSDS